MTVGIDEKGNIIEIYGLSASSGGGGGTLTPTMYILNDTISGNTNLDTVAVASSYNSIVTVPVCDMPVASGWYIVTYKGMLGFTANYAGTKITAVLQTVNETKDTVLNQVFSGHVAGSRNNTYYTVTSIIKVEEGEKLRVAVQQYAENSVSIDNHTRGFIAMRIGDI